MGCKPNPPRSLPAILIVNAMIFFQNKVSPIPIVVITVSSRHDYYGVRNSEGVLQ